MDDSTSKVENERLDKLEAGLDIARNSIKDLKDEKIILKGEIRKLLHRIMVIENTISDR